MATPYAHDYYLFGEDVRQLLEVLQIAPRMLCQVPQYEVLAQCLVLLGTSVWEIWQDCTGIAQAAGCGWLWWEFLWAHCSAKQGEMCS